MRHQGHTQSRGHGQTAEVRALTYAHPHAHEASITMTCWARFRAKNGTRGFGIYEGGAVAEWEGDMFGVGRPTGATLAPGAFTLESPSQPSKIVALWNNFHALAAKLGKQPHSHPLYLIKPSTSLIGPDDPILRPT